MKNYNTQKKIVIAALSLICLCLAAGLIYYLGYIDHSPAPPVISEDASGTVPEVTVPPITVPDNDAATKDSGTIAQSTGTDTTPPPQDGTPSGEKPKTPEEAIPPAPPKMTDEKALTDPAKPPEYTPQQTKPDTKTDKPKSGDKKDGKIYVPGFGWVEDSGESNTQSDTDNGQHNGNKVGEM